MGLVDIVQDRGGLLFLAAMGHGHIHMLYFIFVVKKGCYDF